MEARTDRRELLTTNRVSCRHSIPRWFDFSRARFFASSFISRVCVYYYLFVHVFIDFAFVFCLSNADIDSNDVIYYSRIVHNIVGAISFLSYLRNKFDRKIGSILLLLMLIFVS